jgi:hypothetical protein
LFSLTHALPFALAASALKIRTVRLALVPIGALAELLDGTNVDSPDSITGQNEKKRIRKRFVPLF